MQKLTGYVVSDSGILRWDQHFGGGGFTVPIRMHFASDGLRPAFNGEFTGVIVGVAG